TLMEKIGRLEEDTSNVYTSFHPYDLDKNCSHFDSDNKDNPPKGGSSHESDDVVAEARKQAKDRRYLPCHYFDYIGGSSTGALIAIMLGRLRMPVGDCLDEYKKLAGKVFANPNHIIEMYFPLPFMTRTKFGEKALVQAVNDVISRRRPQDDGGYARLHFPLEEDLCKT
ncbi:MAG: hypothetical protein Q9160_005257, partial [Pyrenula sp. 1 TL-2023]